MGDGRWSPGRGQRWLKGREDEGARRTKKGPGEGAEAIGSKKDEKERKRGKGKGGSGLFLAGELAEDGRAEDEDGADDAPDGNILAEDEDTGDDGDERLQIAEDGDGLDGQGGEAVEIEDVGEAGLQYAEDDEEQDGGKIGREGKAAVFDEIVGQDDQRGDQQLIRAAREGVHGLHFAVAQDDADKAERGGQTHDDTEEIEILIAAIEEAADERHADEGGDDTDGLGDGHLFLEDEGRDRDDDHGCHVIEQAGGGDGSDLIGGEEGDPVETEEDAGQRDDEEIGADAGKIDLLAAAEHEEQNHDGADAAAAEDDELTGGIDILQKQTDGAVEQD